MSVILPTPKSLFLCEGCLSVRSSGLTDLVNIFNAVRPPTYPHTVRDFVVCARLSGGSGPVQFFVELRDAADGSLFHVSNTFALQFQRRTQTVEMALRFDPISFPAPGVYTVELYLENHWACDCTLEML